MNMVTIYYTLLVGLIVLYIIFIIYYMYTVEEPVVYRFYKPSCKYCIESQEEWEKFKIVLSHMKIKSQDVLISDNERLADKYDVESVPTVIYANAESFTKYKGPRTLSNYTKWISSLTP